MRQAQILRDCGFLLKPANQEAQCFAMATGMMQTSQTEGVGFCLDSEEEALDEEILKAEEIEALKVGASRASE